MLSNNNHVIWFYTYCQFYFCEENEDKVKISNLSIALKKSVRHLPTIEVVHREPDVVNLASGVPGVPELPCRVLALQTNGLEPSTMGDSAKKMKRVAVLISGSGKLKFLHLG